MIEMTVIGVAIDPQTAQPIVVLKDIANLRGLPICIGRAEAKAISIALDVRRMERPLTHVLLANIVELLGYGVARIEIDSLDSTTYKATIVLHSPSDKSDLRFVDARPSDAIAVALHAKAPILVSNSLNFIINDELQLELSFKQFLKDLKASDFKLSTTDCLNSEAWEPPKDIEVDMDRDSGVQSELHGEIDFEPQTEIDDSEADRE